MIPVFYGEENNCISEHYEYIRKVLEFKFSMSILYVCAIYTMRFLNPSSLAPMRSTIMYTSARTMAAFFASVRLIVSLPDCFAVVDSLYLFLFALLHAIARSMLQKSERSKELTRRGGEKIVLADSALPHLNFYCM